MTSVSARESREKDDLGDPAPFDGIEAMLCKVLLRSRLLDHPLEKIGLPKAELDGGR